MDLATITSVFQGHCHEGYSPCEVEVCDKNGRIVHPKGKLNV